MFRLTNVILERIIFVSPGITVFHSIVFLKEGYGFPGPIFMIPQ